MASDITCIFQLHIDTPEEVKSSGQLYPLTVTLTEVSTSQQRIINTLSPIRWQPDDSIKARVENFHDGRSSADDIRELGYYLYQTLFEMCRDTKSNQTLRDLLDETRKSHAYVRLAFSIAPPELRAYPWEALYDGQYYLSTRGTLPVVRQTAIQPDIQPKKFARLRMLFVTASPDDEGLSELNVAATLAQIKTTIAENFQPTWKKRLRIERTIDAELLEDASLESLKDKLAEQHSFHVVCFVMHGTATHLYFNHPRYASSDRVTPDKLAATLDDAPDVQLVMLLACDTARQDVTLTPFAHALMEQVKLPAVAAMQTRPQNRQINEFAARFIHFLTEFRPVDVAFAEARRHLLLSNGKATRNTIAPVLYLQTRESNIFKDDFLEFWGLRIFGSVAAFLVVVVVALQIGAFQESLRVAEREAIQQERQLQVVGQIGQFDEVYLGTAPQELLYQDDYLWYIDTSERRLVSRSVTDPYRMTAYDVPAGSHPPLSEGGAIWVVSQTAGEVTRFERPGDESTADASAPLLEEPRTVYVAPELAQGLLTREGLWVSSLLDDSLTHLNHEMETTSFYPRGRSLPLFQSSDYVWRIPLNDETAYRFHIDTLEDTEFTVASDIQDAFFAEGYLWSLHNNRALRIYDPDTLSIVQTIELPVSAGRQATTPSGLWLISDEAASIYHLPFDEPDRMTAAEIMSFPLPGVPRLISAMSDHLLLATDTNRLSFFSLADNRVSLTVETPNISSLTHVIDAGLSYWIPFRSENILMVVDKYPPEIPLFDDTEQTAFQHRQLTFCDEPQSPLFDGSNVRVICAADNTMAAGPADMFYFGLQTYQDMSRTHLPLILDDRVWLVQEGAGDVVVFDPVAERREMTLDLAPDLLPLLADSDMSVWTASSREGRVYRLSPGTTRQHVLDPLVRFDVTVDTIDVAGEVQSLEIIGSHVWVFHADVATLDEEPTVTILNRHTLTPEKTHVLGRAVSGVTRVNDEVWLSVALDEDSVIYRLDADSGTLLSERPITFPDVLYTPWGGTAANNRVYYTFGAPVLNELGEFMRSLFDPDSIRIEPLLYPYNLQTGTWEEPLDIINAPQNPVYDARYEHFWFLSSYSPVFGTVEQDKSGRLFGLDLVDGTDTGILDLCDNADTPRLAGKFVWINCNAPANTLYLFDRETMQQVAAYPASGQKLREPFIVDDRGVFIFEESQTAAIFNVETGERLRQFSVGDAPTAPFLIQDTIWIYNAGDAILQRIHLPTKGD